VDVSVASPDWACMGADDDEQTHTKHVYSLSTTSMFALKNSFPSLTPHSYIHIHHTATYAYSSTFIIKDR
jgi:hypothetical protein